MRIQDNELRKILEEGHNAAVLGKLASDNPYTPARSGAPPSYQRAWQEGWQFGRAELAKKLPPASSMEITVDSPFV